MSPKQTYLIISRSSPYGSQQSRAAADMALTAAAFEEDVTVVFMDDGVWQLHAGQETESGGLKNIGKMIPAFKLYDVNRLCIHQPSAEQRGLATAQFVEDVEPVDDAALQTLAAEADHVMVF